MVPIIALALVLRGSRPLLEHLPVPDRALPVVARQLEILREFQSIHRASVFTQSAEHAPRQIVSERGQYFVFRFRVTFTAHQDQLFGTGDGTQIASDA